VGANFIPLILHCFSLSTLLDRKSQGMTLGLSRFRGLCNGKLGSELYTVATFRLGQVRLRT